MKDILRSHRSALAKLRCGVAPIKLETGGYENLHIDERKCFVCDAVESECNVICECPVYDDLRNILFTKAKEVIHNFETLNVFEKMSIVLSNTEIISLTDKILCDMLKRRRSLFIRINMLYYCYVRFRRNWFVPLK